MKLSFLCPQLPTAGSYHGILATEYEELTTKMQSLYDYGPSSHSGKYHESERSHSDFLKGVWGEALAYCKHVSHLIVSITWRFQ